MRQKQSESMKGKFCPFKPITCQEGYCNDCQIYQDFQGYQRTMGRKPVKELCSRCKKELAEWDDLCQMCWEAHCSEEWWQLNVWQGGII